MTKPKNWWDDDYGYDPGIQGSVHDLNSTAPEKKRNKKRKHKIGFLTFKRKKGKNP